MLAPAYVHHPSSLGHDLGTHPERPLRIAAIERELERKDWLGWEPISAPAATREQIRAVHSTRHVAAIERLCARGGGAIDADTAVQADSLDAALHAAGGAAHVVDLLLGTQARPAAFAALRPPGHHAQRDRAMGFCLFNNVAVAARHARDAHGIERVMIVDWDVHHGNGTNDIFHDTDELLFVSIHQSPLYPGTGPIDDVGAGDGAGYTVNLPVAPGSGDPLYCSLVEHVVAPLARSYEPGLVLISAGFDAHHDDVLAGCEVSDSGFETMAGSLARVCAELGTPVGGVLEGGYDLAALERSVARTLGVLGDPRPPHDAGIPFHPMTSAYAQRLTERWPALAGAAAGPSGD